MKTKINLCSICGKNPNREKNDKDEGNWRVSCCKVTCDDIETWNMIQEIIKIKCKK